MPDSSICVASDLDAYPIIAGIEVTADAEGRYNLNALHRAYEARCRSKQPHKAPAQWQRSKQAQEFVSEVEKQTGKTSLVSMEGRNGGTFAHKTLAVAYLIWLGGTAASLGLLESVENIDSTLKALHDFEVPDDLPDMFVYAIREINSGNIKIGISRDPDRRLRQLQTGNSSKLELVAYRKAENRFSDEQAIHADSSAYRLRGEWFAGDALQEVLQ